MIWASEIPFWRESGDQRISVNQGAIVVQCHPARRFEDHAIYPGQVADLEHIGPGVRWPFANGRLVVDAKDSVQNPFELRIVRFGVRHILPNDVLQAFRDFTAVQPYRNELSLLFDLADHPGVQLFPDPPLIDTIVGQHDYERSADLQALFEDLVHKAVTWIDLPDGCPRINTFCPKPFCEASDEAFSVLTSMADEHLRGWIGWVRCRHGCWRLSRIPGR